MPVRGARWEAMQRGETSYFSGKPCPKGHLAARRTCSGACVICAYETWKRTVASTPRRKAYEAARVRDPLKVRPIKVAWKKRHPDKNAADSNKRRAMKFAACPPWADTVAIKRIYAECREVTERTGIQHHVDHIVPLRHKHVCGLHVPWNLRVITATENHAKLNRIDALLLEVMVQVPVYAPQPWQLDLFRVVT